MTLCDSDLWIHDMTGFAQTAIGHRGKMDAESDQREILVILPLIQHLLKEA